MPTQTFYNLPGEKKNRIIDAATDEFAANGFKNASVARIVEDAGIPRGSFYQYFAHIKDLYKHILDLTVDRKLAYMQNFMARLPELDTFGIIRELYTAGIMFARGEPKLAAIGNNFLKEDEGLKQEIYGEFSEKSHKFFEDLLAQGQEKGEIDPEIDVKVGAQLFFSLNIFIVDYLLNKTQKKYLMDDIEDFLKISDKMLYILENGMKNKERM